MLYWKIVNQNDRFMSVGITPYNNNPVISQDEIPINITREYYYELLGGLNKQAGETVHPQFPTNQCRYLYLKEYNK